MDPGKLLGSGLVLILVGLLSFVLPQFGRQFLLITAAGGGSGIPLVLIGVGVLLAVVAIKKMKSD